MTRQYGVNVAIPAEEVRRHLQELLEEDAFKSSQQLSRFLRYVVEQTLEGNGDRLKAYAVGTEALGRDPGFDPDKDPIVRVEAVRLRKALKTIYLARSEYPVRVVMKPGSYRPEFTRPAGAAEAAVPAVSSLPHRTSEAASELAQLRKEIRRLATVEVIMAVVILGIILELTVLLFHHVKHPV